MNIDLRKNTKNPELKGEILGYRGEIWGNRVNFWGKADKKWGNWVNPINPFRPHPQWCPQFSESE